MAKVISIEISQVLTKICVTNYKEKNPRVYKSITIATPHGVIADGTLNPRESFVQLLRDTFERNKIKEKRLVFSITSNKIASREVTIPYVKENRIAEVLHANAEEYFPVDLSDYRMAHTLLGTIGEGANRQHKVLMLAVPQTLLEGYFDVARMLGMEIAAIDYAGNSLLQATMKTYNEGTNLIAKIDGASTMLMVMTDGIMTSFRTIPYGVNDVVRAIQRSISNGNAGYVEAVEELQQHTYIGNSQWEGVVDLEAMEEIGSALEMLANGITRVIDFHNSKPENSNIEKVILTGIGGSFGGMSVLMQERLGLFTVPLDNVDGLVVPREFIDQSLGNYIGCIGAAMKPLDLLSVFKAKKGKAGSGRNTNMVLPILIAVACFVGSGVLFVSATMPYNEAVAENRRLKSKETQLLPAEQVYNTYMQANDLWTKVHTMNNMTANDNDRFVEFISELEAKMPSEMTMTSMATTSSGVTMNITVGSKEAAAKVLQQLRTFDSLAAIDITSVSDEMVDTDNHTVVFSVNCVYAGVVTREMNEEMAQLLADDTESAE